MNQQKHRACKIGLYLFPAEGWMNGETARWDDIKAMAQTAEAIGFDSLLPPDACNVWSLSPNLMTLLF